MAPDSHSHLHAISSGTSSSSDKGRPQCGIGKHDRLWGTVVTQACTCVGRRGARQRTWRIQDATRQDAWSAVWLGVGVVLCTGVGLRRHYIYLGTYLVTLVPRIARTIRRRGSGRTHVSGRPEQACWLSQGRRGRRV